jgi:hypothetical protein
VEDQQTFQRDISPPSSGLASLPASLMLVSWLAHPSDLSTWNVCWLSTDYTVFYPWRQNPSYLMGCLCLNTDIQQRSVGLHGVESWIWNDVQGSFSGLIQVLSWLLLLRIEQSHERPVGIFGIQTEIRTEYISNINPESYRCINLLGSSECRATELHVRRD